MLSAQSHDQSSLGLSMSAHQIFSGAPSSISANSSTTTDKQKKTQLKRKQRLNDAASDSADSSSQPRTRDGPKKKKANRACFHCQKAHLTCDDCESPCLFTRCYVFSPRRFYQRRAGPGATTALARAAWVVPNLRSSVLCTQTSGRHMDCTGVAPAHPHGVRSSSCDCVRYAAEWFSPR